MLSEWPSGGWSSGWACERGLQFFLVGGGLGARKLTYWLGRVGSSSQNFFGGGGEDPGGDIVPVGWPSGWVGLGRAPGRRACGHLNHCWGFIQVDGTELCFHLNDLHGLRRQAAEGDRVRP